MVRPKDEPLDYWTIVAPEFTAGPPLRPVEDAEQPLSLTTITVTTTTDLGHTAEHQETCVRLGVITREPLGLVSPTRLGEIFHSTDVRFSDQRFDRCDERRAAFSTGQLQTLSDFTIRFQKHYDSQRSTEVMQRNSERLSALDQHSQRYLIVPLEAPQSREEQQDEDVVEELLVGWLSRLAQDTNAERRNLS